MALDKINPAAALSVAQSGSQTSSMKSHGETLQSEEALPRHWVSALFRKFQARYGHKWMSVIDGIEEEAVNEWAQALAGLAGEQIARGLDVWREEWPPSVFEFMKACRPSVTDLGAPEIEESLMIVCRRSWGEVREARWKHPVVFHAARDPGINLFSLQRMSRQQALKTWRPVYERYLARLQAGEQFEFPAEKVIEDRTRKAVTPEEKERLKEVARESLSFLRRVLRKGRRVPLSPWARVHGMKCYV